MKSLLFCPLLCLLVASGLSAAEGDPIAVRSWPGGVVSIETQWGLGLAVKPSTSDELVVPDDVGQILAVGGDRLNHVLSRLPNQADVQWSPVGEASKWDPNAIEVRTIDDHTIRIDVDGVRVIVVSGDGTGTFMATKADKQNVDVLVLSNIAVGQLASDRIKILVRSWRPQFVLPLAIPADETDASKRAAANTFAVSASEAPNREPKTVLISQTPWEMPDELAVLFGKMEQACSESQQVFAELSVEQLNFKPANGTHTPRWNVEHMMGRQLQFFSQIYHAIDSSIPVMNLNPKQMPADYQFAHPDWDGAEEARQMQRASEFCRRFAYLLDGMSVNDKAPGSRWPSLRALLVQMQKHYHEHTENTVKKFELPGWPKS
ncbi:DinB family protein [Aporhodopirellula aestuarii]|uniref:DinB family protein n=1 Tax=Aporhodopirellula aestuarii TaxID=2950107 RepID=A0ABT0U9S7_9BACT|nr:DinB family protein [Aporhodopirellula aestuarii]MCM2373737.1 DinB family protein [Aporhodopirellula aestuarii]